MTGPLPNGGGLHSRRARIRRLTLLLVLAAAAVYVGFIVLQVMAARG